MSKSGTEKVRIISVLEFVVDGLGKAFTNPYEFVSAGLYDYSKERLEMVMNMVWQHQETGKQSGISMSRFWRLWFG